MNKKFCIGITGESLSKDTAGECILIKNLHNESDIVSFYSSIDSEDVVFIVQDFSHASYRDEIFQKSMEYSIQSGLPVILVQVIRNTERNSSAWDMGVPEIREHGYHVPIVRLSYEHLKIASPGTPLRVFMKALQSLGSCMYSSGSTIPVIPGIFSADAIISLNYINSQGQKFSLGTGDIPACHTLLVTLVFPGDESVKTCEDRVIQHSPDKMRTTWGAAICREMTGIESYGWFISTYENGPDILSS